MSAEGYYIVAHVTNAISPDRAEVELAIASESIDGNWFTTEGTEVWPFWKQPIEFAAPSIPEGWIEHLHQLANKRAVGASRFDLASALGIMRKLHAPTPPMKRRL